MTSPQAKDLRERLLARKAELLERTLLEDDRPDEEVARELREVSLALDRLRRGVHDAKN